MGATLHTHGPLRRRRRLQFWPCLVLLLCAQSVGICRADGEPCAEVVVLEGDSRLTRLLSPTLSAHGLLGKPQAGCPLLRVRLRRQGAAIRIYIQREFSQVDKTVHGARTAVAVIESWAKTAISAPLLGEWRPVAVTIATLRDASARWIEIARRAASLPPRATVALQPQGPPRRQPPHRLLLTLSAEAGPDMAGALWLSGSLRLCAMIRGFCLGTVWRTGIDLPASRGDLPSDQRVASEVLLSIDRPLRLGSITLSPGLGLGIGWTMHLVGNLPAPPKLGSNNDGDEAAGLPTRASDTALRGELRLNLALPPQGGLRVELGLTLGLGMPGSDPPIVLVGAKTRSLALPAWGVLRAGLGLRWSGL